jgi:hypothetical protein
LAVGRKDGKTVPAKQMDCWWLAVTEWNRLIFFLEAGSQFTLVIDFYLRV